jgi:hypothetical protein
MVFEFVVNFSLKFCLLLVVCFMMHRLRVGVVPAKVGKAGGLISPAGQQIGPPALPTLARTGAMDTPAPNADTNGMVHLTPYRTPINAAEV